MSNTIDVSNISFDGNYSPSIDFTINGGISEDSSKEDIEEELNNVSVDHDTIAYRMRQLQAEISDLERARDYLDEYDEELVRLLEDKE